MSGKKKKGSCREKMSKRTEVPVQGWGVLFCCFSQVAACFLGAVVASTGHIEGCEEREVIHQQPFHSEVEQVDRES